MEGKDLLQHPGQNEYNVLRNTVSLILRMCRHLWIGKAVVLDSVFFVDKYITELEAKGVCAEALIKKQWYWPKGVLGDLIDTHF